MVSLVSRRDGKGEGNEGKPEGKRFAGEGFGKETEVGRVIKAGTALVPGVCRGGGEGELFATGRPSKIKATAPGRYLLPLPTHSCFACLGCSIRRTHGREAFWNPVMGLMGHSRLAARIGGPAVPL